MKTRIYPPASGIGRTRTVGVVAHQLTGAEAFGIAARLAGDGLYVLPTVDKHHVLHLRPVLRPLTTGEEVTVLRAYCAATDCRISWHREVE